MSTCPCGRLVAARGFVTLVNPTALRRQSISCGYRRVGGCNDDAGGRSILGGPPNRRSAAPFQCDEPPSRAKIASPEPSTMAASADERFTGLRSVIRTTTTRPDDLVASSTESRSSHVEMSDESKPMPRPDTSISTTVRTVENVAVDRFEVGHNSGNVSAISCQCRHRNAIAAASRSGAHGSRGR